MPRTHTLWVGAGRWGEMDGNKKEGIRQNVALLMLTRKSLAL